jgi:hypothetical protein
MNTQQQNQKLANLESDIAALLVQFKINTGMNIYCISSIQTPDGGYEFISGIDIPEDYEMSEDSIHYTESSDDNTP